MATPAAATTGFLGEFGLHLINGVKMLGQFFVDLFSMVWQVMWTGGLATFLIFAVLLMFFFIALVKFAFHSAKSLIVILVILAIITALTALGLLL